MPTLINQEKLYVIETTNLKRIVTIDRIENDKPILRLQVSEREWKRIK